MNDLPADLSSADGVIVTSPGSFGSSEPQELTDFVNDGGAVYPFDQSDYDETTNFNEVADALCVVFRFNDDEVTDTENNADEDDRLLTNEFNESFAVFGDRDGLGLEAGETFEVTVTDVSDGDTCEVEFADGTTEDVFDAPRTLPNDVASGVGPDLRLNEDRVTDDTNDVDNDPELLTTSAFDSFSYPPQHLIRKI